MDINRDPSTDRNIDRTFLQVFQVEKEYWLYLWDLQKCKYPTWEGDQRQDNRNGYIDKQEKKKNLCSEQKYACIFMNMVNIFKQNLGRGIECGYVLAKHDQCYSICLLGGREKNTMTRDFK